MNRFLLGLLMLVARGIFAADLPDEDQSRELFAGDIVNPFTDQTPSAQQSSWTYLDPATLPEADKLAWQVLRSGLTRAECKGWTMNGDVSTDEYYRGQLPMGRSLAVRMVFRPAEMPELVFSDPVTRIAWIHDHLPDASPTDILVRFSKPFSTNRIPSPSETLFASIRLTQDAFSGVEKGRTGFFFYIDASESYGPMLTGYRYHHDRINLKDQGSVFGGGSGSKSTVAELCAVNLQPFDFAAEVKSCEVKLRRKAKAQGRRFYALLPVDGAEYEIVVMTSKGPMSLQAWNPGYTIDFYAAHSRKIAKLKAVLDILARYYGRLQFGA